MEDKYYDILRHYDHSIDVSQDSWGNGITARFRAKNPIDGTHWVLVEGKFKALDPSNAIDEEYMPMKLEKNKVQKLMDDLWCMGFRPSKHQHGELSAMEKHLTDMRKMAFGILRNHGVKFEGEE